jgi:DNA polymerase III sliding clamp (beta) subunit (PCNA family)
VTDILNLAEMEGDLAPEILPVDARLSIRGTKQTLVRLFERAAALLPAKEVIAGTQFALFEAIDAEDSTVSHVRITASDGEQTISMVSDLPIVSMSGKVLLPAKRVHDILRLCPDSIIKIEVVGTACTIRAGRAQWTVAMPTGNTLPPVPDVTGMTYHSVPRVPFLKALSATRRAVGQVFRAALMQAEVVGGAMTTCDGARVHRQRIEGMPEDLQFTIPIKVMDELSKFLRDNDDEHFEVGVADGHLGFRVGEHSLIANRLYLKFPVVENLLLEPALSNGHTLIVEMKDLKEAIPRVRINADQEYAAVFLMLMPGKKDAEGKPTFQLAIRARDPQANAAQEIIDCQFTGPAATRELCFNHKMLMDLLEAYETDLARFKIGDDTKTQKNPLFVEDKQTGFTGTLQQMRSDWMK